MPDDNAPAAIQPHLSYVRQIMARFEGAPFAPLDTLAEARTYHDGVIIFEGDYGGAIYLTCPARMVQCAETSLRQLLLDIDEKFFAYGPSTKLCYERLAEGSGVCGGWGGGRITMGIWLHPKVEMLGLRDQIEEVFTGLREHIA